MIEPALDHAIDDATQSLTNASLRVQLLRRRLDTLAADRAALAAEFVLIQQAVERLRVDFRALSDAAGGNRGSGAGSA